MVPIEQIKAYTREDFLRTTEPYEFAYQFIDDPFTLGRVLEEMSAVALAVKVRNFKALFKSYVETQKASGGLIVSSSATQFEDQPLELNCGQWRADDTGIYLDSPMGEVCACTHPVLPVQRLVNIDTGVEKLQLAYRKSRQWRRIVVEKKTIASNNSIVELANLGIAVTSENARFLVKYLHDIETLNYDLIPERSAVSRLGWIDGEGFAPYVEDLVFDGDANFRHYFEAVKPCGSYDKWLELAKGIRQGAAPARIILAASFASALIRPLSCLPFFVHLWGGTEAGKTVGLMLAASVWASPEMGKYIHTFNSTAVGMEKAAAFCNSLPLILDELQIMANRKSFDEDIMKLAEGVGRTRGNKLGGVDMTPTWSNCILTNGEMPITGSTSGGGAVNRIVEIECVDKLFDDPRGVVDVVKRKDTYVYENKTAADVTRMIAEDFQLNVGTLDDPGYRIASRVEDNQTLFDIVQNAIDETLKATGKMFVLFDDAGKLTLRELSGMRLNLLVNADTAGDFDYKSSIASETYNRVKLSYENKDTGEREIYIAQDGENINQWGVLQYYEKIDNKANAKAMADALLDLYNTKTRTLKIQDALGDIRVRGGTLLVVMLDLGDTKVSSYLMVESVKHKFKDGQHLMEMKLRGGKFVV